MEVTRPSRTARIFGTLLALAASVGSAGADDGFVEVGDQESTLVIAGGDGAEYPPMASDQLGSQLTVHAGDEPEMVAVSDSATPSAQGTLTVVANAHRKSRPTSLTIDPSVQPAAARADVSAAESRESSWGMRFSKGPRRPGAVAGIQQRQVRPGTPTAPQVRRQASPQGSANIAAQPKPKQAPVKTALAAQRDNQPAPTPKAGATVRKAEPQRSAQAGPAVDASPAAGDALLQAYQLSTTATTEADYSQIVRWCADGMRQGLDGENRTFALNLSAWALNRRGQLRADQGQNEIAVADFRAALEFDPQCWRALHNRGVTLAQNGQFAEAFDDISKVIELNPAFAKAYSNRATLYIQAGDHERAIADYDAALQLDPTMLPALVGRGRVCHMSGRLEEALESLNAACEQQAANADLFCSRGDLLLDLGRYDEALADYSKAIELNPQFEHAYRNGAWLLATCPDETIRDAEGALKGAQAALDCGYGERHAALDTMAAALANAGRFEEAIGTIQQAIEIAPQEAVPAYQARQQLYESGQPFRTHPVGDDVQAVEFVEG